MAVSPSQQCADMIAHKEDLCGLGPCRPKWLQKLRNIQIFTLFACGAIVTQGLYLGYAIGVLTTIEKRFEIPSASSGALLSVYDVGHSLSVLLIGHFGAYLNKPKWIAWGNFLSAISCIGLASPNFIYGPLPSSFANSSIPEPSMCIANGSEFDHQQSCAAKHTDSAYWILVFFQLLAGMASAPSVPLIFVYIDDNCSTQQSPLYNGFVTAMWALGPAIGIGFSSVVARWYVTLEAVTMDSSSPSWIGAWWLGFVVCSAAYLLFGLPMLLFPASLSRPLHEVVVVNERPKLSFDRKESKTLSGLEKHQDIPTMTAKLFWTELIRLPLEVWHLLKNPMFICLSVMMVFGATIIGGYATFMPKYIEVEFYKSTDMANIYAGVVFIFGVALSTAIGGKILSLLDLLPKTMTMALFGTFVAGFVSYLIAMLFGCDNIDIQGIRSIGHLNNSGSYSSCQPNCYCSNDYSPVCSDSVTFFSPCHAGCLSTGFNESFANQFSNCSCTTSGIALAERCEHPCPKFVFYIIIVFIGSFVTNMFQVAVINLVMWSVEKERKTTSVALASVISSILGFMPAQIAFGKLIDSSCLHWSSKGCDEASGYCQLYANEYLRIVIHLATMGLSVGCIIAALAAFLFARNFKFHLNVPDDSDDVNMDELS